MERLVASDRVDGVGSLLRRRVEMNPESPLLSRHRDAAAHLRDHVEVGGVSSRPFSLEQARRATGDPARWAAHQVAVSAARQVGVAAATGAGIAAVVWAFTVAVQTAVPVPVVGALAGAVVGQVTAQALGRGLALGLDAVRDHREASDRSGEEIRQSATAVEPADVERADVDPLGERPGELLDPEVAFAGALADLADLELLLSDDAFTLVLDTNRR